MKILVLGSNGQLGKCIQELDFGPDHTVIFANKSDVDVANSDQVAGIVTRIRPDILINASGYTAVDKAETETREAEDINHLAVKHMAYICREIGSILIHISTDYVFDGKSGVPYSEEDPTNPECVYGLSKLKGEQAIVDSGCKFYIVRTSWVFSEFGDNFLKTMLKIGQKKNDIRVVCDQFGCPTYAQDIASCILVLVNHSTTHKTSFGIYHFSGSVICSWYEFANTIFRKAKDIGITTPRSVTAVPSSEYITPATRPHFSVLDSSKFRTTFGFSASCLEDSIDRVFSKLFPR